jgi:hypothetical protein
MVIVPVRSAPVAFAEAANMTWPLPVPDDPPVIDSHSGWFETAVHAHDPPVVTAMAPEPPAAAMVWLAGAIENVHGAACCVTVSVCPPMVMVPLRAAPGFRGALNTTTPFPVPDDPAVMVIQGAFDVALQAHPVPALTFVLPSPPAAAMSTASGDSAKPHGAAAWVTVKVCAAIVAVPVRDAPEFAATLSLTVPGPVPVPPEAIVIHGAFVTDVHAHDPPVITEIVEVPPAAATASLDGLIE